MKKKKNYYPKTKLPHLSGLEMGHVRFVADI